MIYPMILTNNKNMRKYNLKNPYLGYDKYIYHNDEEDFKMPYFIYGKTDKQNMLDRYKFLTNKPKDYRHVRFSQMLEEYK
jgi:hypothetical protein